LSVLAVLVETRAERGVRPADMTVTRGETAMFNCSGTWVSWYHTERLTGKILVIFRSPDKIYTHGRGDDKYAIVGKYNLIIHNTEINADEGKYHCNTDETHIVKSAYLTVIGNGSVCCIRFAVSPVA